MKSLIVYVHGALSTRNSWNFVRQQLLAKVSAEEAKDLIEEFIQYDLSTELAEDITVDMQKRITALLKKHDVNKLVFIGHSFGGVLCVAVVHQLKALLDEKKIKVKVITLSSPFAGSEVATLLRVLKPRSIFFKNVGTTSSFIIDFKKKSLPCKTHIFVTTEGGSDWMPQANDGVVTVESQRFFEKDPSATHQVVKSNHFEILVSDAVVNQLYKDIK